MLDPRKCSTLVSGLLVTSLLLSPACSDDATPPDAGGDGPVADQALDATKPDQRAPDLANSCAGQPDELELKYDDGQAEGFNSPRQAVAGAQVGVSFTPPCYPVTIASAGFYVSAGGKPTTEFQVRVYKGEELDGKPGADLLPQVVKGQAKAGDEWVWVDLSSHKITVDQGDVLVAMQWLTAPGLQGADAQFISVDRSAPTDKRSWWRWAGTGKLWEPIKLIGTAGDRDLMIRIKIKTR